MGDITKFLSPKLIKIDMQAENKNAAIEELAELLYKEHVLKDKANYIQNVLEREAQVPTNLENRTQY